MSDLREIARRAVATALRTRLSAGYELENAVCVYDLAEKLGAEVRFLDLPSLEGMYLCSPDATIIVSSLRPYPRRSFTCAHELGHHAMGEGTGIDLLVEQWNNPCFDPKEFSADCFAGALLMPKLAVSRAFAIRGWRMEDCSPGQVYAISCYFGVGYATLIHHMWKALRILSTIHARRLLKVSPRDAQALLLGWRTPDTAIVVDLHWTGRAIDVEVGDLVIVNEGAQSEGDCVEPTPSTRQGRVFRAITPGIGRLVSGTDWSAFVRVSRRSYVGRSAHRHLAEVRDV